MNQLNFADLKQFTFILLLSALFLSERAFSATSEDSKAEKESSKPSTEITTDPELGDTKENSAISENSESNSSASAKSDSLSNYNSSCKFNFIFYFIYKVKYDENGEVGSSSLDFEF